MNAEQVKSIIRQLLLFVGGMIAGTSFVSKFLTADQVTAILTSDVVMNTLVGLVMSAGAGFWAFISRSDKNLVAAANAVPAVAGVITKPTPEGRELANAVPAETVVPAATSEAAAVAKAG